MGGTEDRAAHRSVPVTGEMWTAICEECPQAQYTGMALEYGTLPGIQVVDALRADQWLENHPDAPESVRLRIKRQIRNAFYTDTDAWNKQIIDQAREALLLAATGLSV